MKIKKTPHDSPISVIPQNAGLVGGSLPGKKKGRNEANQSHAVYGVFGASRMSNAGTVEQTSLL